MAKNKGKSQPQNVALDINSPEFLGALFALPPDEKLLVIDLLRKVSQMTWDQVYRDKGLHWEEIHSVKPPTHLGIDKWYSVRVSRGRRAVACRVGNTMRLLTIPPDHDSTYQ